MKVFTGPLLWLLPITAICQSQTTVAPAPWQTGVVTLDGTCAGKEGFVCSPSWGACCSADGLCGRSSKFCGTGCQPAFGNCNAPVVVPPVPGPGSPSTDGSCGGAKQFNCTGTSFGACCSSGGWCGDTAAHCAVDSGCQSLFGSCSAASPVSSDGSCGANGKICPGSTFGDCCSTSGFCGATIAHCGPGCQAGFGNCTSTDTSISTDGSCGSNGKTCKGSTFGDCCSSSGFCGTSTGHCDAAAGCNSGFGTCTGSDSVSTDGSCGKNGKTCIGSTFGDCCSSSGFCGKTTTHCDAAAGCQSGSGTCTGSNDVSVNGLCAKNGKTCKGSTFGDCCSSSGFCGASSTHCSAGCQTKFGTCTTGTGNISTDGACGKNGKTCKGSTFGDCCSPNGFCGKSTDHCNAGCQATFGTCTSGSSGSISINGECGSKNGKTCVGSTFGDCCSSAGFCGGTVTHCGVGCQKSSSNACLMTRIPSADGTCGSTKGGLTCAGGAFNNQCCSSNGFCGTTTAHCSSGW
ncbi:hypothetical protein BKA65DRAFT_416224 [Rhexocercosporidium sp. MPI-PUGE-AT-0058]|nr:hypothetical protein BKA65DRAFT_416224 [Rhexocercosporidium sp. MPI-PUGE-AT-0058]